MKKMFSIFQNKNYALLFFASFTSQMGGIIGLTALLFYLLDRFSNQPAYATMTELMLSLPTLAVFFLVGVFADKFDRQKIAKNCDWICMGLSIVLLLSLYLEWMPFTFAVLFLRNAVKSFFTPAQTSLIQGILSENEYSLAVGLNQMVASLFMLFGNGLGVFCYWTLGVEGAVMVDAASFALSGLLIQACRISDAVRMPNGKHSIRQLNIAGIWKDFTLGFTYILNHKLLLALVSGFVLFGVVNGGLSVMQVFILKYKLAPVNYEEMSIVLGIVFGAGFLAGSIAASLLSQKLKLYQLLILALIVCGCATISGSLVKSLWLYMVCSCFIAVSLPSINVAIGGWIPNIVNPKMMGRVQGWIHPLMMLSQSLTLLFIAWLYPAWIALESLYWLVGGSLIAVGVFYMIILPKFLALNRTADVSVD
ncbi:MFS transporter [Bacillus paralicheniformis]|uniref:MFS transporter n=1 Tax=Bacillus TaxID=1386 RepID=UPI000BA62DD9|nr:MFS transporter [Bacillus paralicheniformis]MBR8664602.1 MFS transporter [Bacillus paralicheniformis]MBU8581787.1 MFS transporter [Bacillus paralicheniformis]MCY8040114.1 MFS transporter [Bacillus paralicheniformis]MDR9801080.1 MFS transporter [Bacillus paralicheniformis]MED1066609.1 MFS transporter [Bacillus paralicheniformis]